MPKVESEKNSIAYIDRTRSLCARENEHLRNLAPDHNTPAYTDTEAKFSSQKLPQECAPTANLGTQQVIAFCTRTTFCTRWHQNPLVRFDCRCEGFAHDTSRSESHALYETSVLFTRLLHLVHRSTFVFQRNAHNSECLKSQFMRIAHR